MAKKQLTSKAKRVTCRRESHPRNLPMYFKGKPQSQEFARGAWAVVDMMESMQAQAEDREHASSDRLTANLADPLMRAVAPGGDYASGAVAAMIELLAFNETSGQPNLEVWRPLQMELRYTAQASHPTRGSTLYELDGVAVSVAPDLTVSVWNDYDESRIERSASFLARVQKHGLRISLQEFTALRGKRKRATRARSEHRSAVQQGAGHG